MNKKASTLPLHLEILKDFSVIGAADLAALAAYDHIHRNDPTPAVRIETPTSENRYINHIVKQAAASRIALRKVTQGTEALSAKDGAYNRSLSHMPSEKDSIVKAATEEDQTSYSPHYARNASLTGLAMAAPGAVYSGLAYKRHLNYKGLAEAAAAARRNAFKAGDEVAAKALHKEYKANAAAAAFDGLNTLVGGGVAAGGAVTGAGLGLAATGINHYLHRAREKQANWFTSSLDEVADVAKGTKNLMGSFTNHLTGRNVKEHMIDVVQPRGGKAVHELNKKTDLERYALTSEGSPNHAKLHDLIQKRKASRVLAGGVVGAGALNYYRDKPSNGQNYGMVYQ